MDDVTGDSPTVASAALRNVHGVVAGRYEVRARLGRGATKEVYLAYDERLDREVALAIVVAAGGSDAAALRVVREAQVTGRLGDHPNIITVYDTGDHEGLPYLVLRAMRGGSLAELLDRERPSFADAIRLGGEIAAGLAHAHAHDVVHRDVKPDNVWLTEDGAAALGDFGIAHLLGSQRLTAEGVVVGTVRYLSPELIRGEDVGPPGDLYALGVTLYEIVTGHPPFTAGDATQILTQHLASPPRPPSEAAPDMPPALESLILDLLAKEPASRPASAVDVVAALAQMRATAVDRPPAPRPPDARRLVSVLAARADVADPEALHSMFDRCAAVIEQHGGTVERYLGDAVVGVFGLNESQGDEALRAARAAVELSTTTTELRLGIESGEVFFGAGPRGAPVATGAAITAAGRLAEHAAEGEILLGEDVRRVVGADASIDPSSGRLLALHIEQPALLRAPATPFVGRERELAALRAALDEVREEGACRLVTVAGPPGIGKSRLAGEFVAAVGGDVTVLAGRCLAYGEGTTYRALADIVHGLGGEPRERVEELLAGDEQAVRGILSAIGQSGEPAQPEETAWALRRLLERLARERPLVVAIEDIHWAEPALLDLLDHVVALSSHSPILLVCLTRPELLDALPAWGAPQPNRSVLVLDALGSDDARELAERLGAGGVADRIAARAEGNPLFVEQLVAVDEDGDGGELPTSIQAVLAARIDRLQAGERVLLQRAAVEGRTFHASAVAALLGDHERRALGARLVALARKGLIGSDRPEYPGEDAFRFTHALIREAAYASVTKLARADLHAKLAEWLEQRPESEDEIVGYHLEQGVRLRAELGRSGDDERRLATRAVDRFRRASNVAMGRGDPAGASALLARAVTLVESDRAARGALLPSLGASLFEAGRMTEATRVLDEAISEAPEERLSARAEVERELVRLATETGVGTERARAVADAALPVLEREGDSYGQSRAWSLRAHAAWPAGLVAEADDAWSQAADCARRAGDERELFDVLGWRATAAVFGPRPVQPAIELCEGFRATVAASPVAVAWTINPLALLHAMRDDFERAEQLLAEAAAILDELGSLASSASHLEAAVRLLEDRPDAAEAALRSDIEPLTAMNATTALATTHAMLAQAVYLQGRHEEAGALALRTAELAAPDDIFPQAIWRGVQAKVLARDGRAADAAALAQEAVSLARPTDFLSLRGDSLLDLAEVLRLGSPAAVSESDDTLRAAIALYECKGNAVAAARARSALETQPGGT
ncbi:MAG TPA: protein kinase [Solirubrobacteraceae bacterium]|nr:protein kinase [Solirubrobacteraceae bacterium]